MDSETMEDKMRTILLLTVATLCLAQTPTTWNYHVNFGTPVRTAGFTLDKVRQATPLTQVLMVGAWGGAAAIAPTYWMTKGKHAWIPAAISVVSIFALYAVGRDKPK